jgi:hypothetical protein
MVSLTFRMIQVIITKLYLTNETYATSSVHFYEIVMQLWLLKDTKSYMYACTKSMLDTVAIY